MSLATEVLRILTTEELASLENARICPETLSRSCPQTQRLIQLRLVEMNFNTLTLSCLGHEIHNLTRNCQNIDVTD
ncbi:hypothetical protein DS901_16420 [Loktanella sp. D2R18]|uniref:hypothetical protein n=1 Tax=Rhodobacterales TaxID=204455 RepID=UPI000DEA92E5|nr:MULTISPECIES: hypothetical protein [Rhodobacterales]MCG3268656.1 hypothetical protein [Yoonia sp. I 8.24]MDO6591802.1 hypothetical protein [Yoonia sp. 1_MG-2023]RBW42282.1 hypothetical protein DS901_16420 [Loktanella sp. D2R18]